MAESKPSKFNLRAMVSLTLVMSFLIVAASSCALFCMKRLGTKAFLGLPASDWRILHSVLGCFFLAALVVHVLIHLKALVRYVGKAFGKGRGGGLELILALILVAGLTTTAMLDVPPASWLAKRPAAKAAPKPSSQETTIEIEIEGEAEPYDPANDTGATETHATPEQ